MRKPAHHSRNKMKNWNGNVNVVHYFACCLMLFLRYIIHLMEYR